MRTTALEWSRAFRCRAANGAAIVASSYPCLRAIVGFNANAGGSTDDDAGAWYRSLLHNRASLRVQLPRPASPPPALPSDHREILEEPRVWRSGKFVVTSFLQEAVPCAFSARRSSCACKGALLVLSTVRSQAEMIKASYAAVLPDGGCVQASTCSTQCLLARGIVSDRLAACAHGLRVRRSLEHIDVEVRKESPS